MAMFLLQAQYEGAELEVVVPAADSEEAVADFLAHVEVYVSEVPE